MIDVSAEVVQLHDFKLFEVLNALTEKGIISLDVKERIKEFMIWEQRSMPLETNVEKVVDDVVSLYGKSKNDIKKEWVILQSHFEIDDRDFPIAGLHAEMLTNEDDVLVRYLVFRLLAEMYSK